MARARHVSAILSPLARPSRRTMRLRASRKVLSRLATQCSARPVASSTSTSVASDRRHGAGRGCGGLGTRATRFRPPTGRLTVPMLLLDSTVLIAYLRGRPAADRVDALLSAGETLVTTGINVEEIARGLHPDEEEGARRLIAGLGLVPVGAEEGWLAGTWRREGGPQGQEPHPSRLPHRRGGGGIDGPPGDREPEGLRPHVRRGRGLARRPVGRPRSRLAPDEPTTPGAGPRCTSTSGEEPPDGVGQG